MNTLWTMEPISSEAAHKCGVQRFFMHAIIQKRVRINGRFAHLSVENALQNAHNRTHIHFWYRMNLQDCTDSNALLRLKSPQKKNKASRARDREWDQTLLRYISIAILLNKVFSVAGILKRKKNSKWKKIYIKLKRNTQKRLQHRNCVFMRAE